MADHILSAVDTTVHWASRVELKVVESRRDKSQLEWLKVHVIGTADDNEDIERAVFTIFGDGDAAPPVTFEGGEAGKGKGTINAELLWFAQQIFAAKDTGMLKLDSPADETLANVLARGRAAISSATP